MYEVFTVPALPGGYILIGFGAVDPIEVHRDWFKKFLDIEYRGVYVFVAMNFSGLLKK